MTVTFSPSSYNLGATLVSIGLLWWHGLVAAVIGSVILVICLVANSRGAIKYHVGFPVYVRFSAGITGSKLFICVRAIVAIIYFATQTYYAGKFPDYGFPVHSLTYFQVASCLLCCSPSLVTRGKTSPTHSQPARASHPEIFWRSCFSGSFNSPSCSSTHVACVGCMFSRRSTLQLVYLGSLAGRSQRMVAVLAISAALVQNVLKVVILSGLCSRLSNPSSV